MTQTDATPEPSALPMTQTLSSQTLILASLLAAVLVVALLVLFTRRKSQSRGNSLVLVGVPDSGKTALFTSLVYNQTVPTHTSLQTNSSIVPRSAPKQPFGLIDIPGHPRIREQFKEFVPDAKALVFVVDANTVSRNGSVVAEHLHSVMNAIVSLPPSHTLPTLIVLAHKADLVRTASTSFDPISFAVNRVQTVLERELEKRRASQSGGMGVESMGGEDEKTDIGGLECSGPDSTFKFENWDGGEVLFIGTSIKELKTSQDSKDGLFALQDWIEENM
ncbi:hypothetical protein K435DRAFT_685178 [Dendrothele bispora CBS 962.96]|uniref:Signal recognition particle receptor subunit beta n=1 Tax=Dendrothele bispora (strain CBS 962.96) TaxID=1314807 RepID=A0A4S8LA72_DENBC|nr:hypothetical protein K435DRAFT_685178 [Dendrothele bispora CBS 962.96]